MSLIKQVKDLQISSRKEKNKDAVSALTMLISRADNDRVKYGLKSTDEMTDEQVLKVIQAEFKSIEQEISFLKDEDKIAKLQAAKDLMSTLLPQEVTVEEMADVINKAIQMNGVKPSIGPLMKDSQTLLTAMFPNKTINKGQLSKLIKEAIDSI